MRKQKKWLAALLLCACLGAVGCAVHEAAPLQAVLETAAITGGGQMGETSAPQGAAEQWAAGTVTVEEVPEYSGSPYAVVNDNEPDFSQEQLTDESFEAYSQLDELGRCQTAVASIGTDLMPTEERESISQVKPTGWHSVRYDIVEGESLYNRCHLIGFQLSGENANEENLITGTRYLNVEGMLPFENMVADYVKETENHVLYQVTPIFQGDNLVASGVQIEAQSVEDAGEGICFNVYCYNVQPGISIDYATGESSLAEDSFGEADSWEAPFQGPEEDETYILNTNTRKFHRPACGSAKKISPANREEYTGSREELESLGYEPCGICQP